MSVKCYKSDINQVTKAGKFLETGSKGSKERNSHGNMDSCAHLSHLGIGCLNKSAHRYLWCALCNKPQRLLFPCLWQYYKNTDLNVTTYPLTQKKWRCNWILSHEHTGMNLILSRMPDSEQLFWLGFFLLLTEREKNCIWWHTHIIGNFYMRKCGDMKV